MEDIGEENENGWAPFVLIRGTERQSLRARHDAHDDTNDLMAGFAKLNPELEVLVFVPPTQSDTLICLILSGAEAGELRAGMGEQYSRWFAPPRPEGATLIEPA